MTEILRCVRVCGSWSDSFRNNWATNWILSPCQDLYLWNEDHQSGPWRCWGLQVWGDSQRRVWQLHLWDLGGGWVKMNSGLLRLPQILTFWFDPTIMCVVCNFSCYSCPTGQPGRYFVCFQESVSASGPVFSLPPDRKYFVDHLSSYIENDIVHICRFSN